MKRKDAPKREAARAERERAGMWLDVLFQGVSKKLDDMAFRDTESLQPLLDIVNGPLTDAMKKSQAAEEAYRPYRRRLLRVYRAKRKPTAVEKFIKARTKRKPLRRK